MTPNDITSFDTTITLLTARIENDENCNKNLNLLRLD